MEALRPYLAVFSSRFLLMMQYRAAALAGFTTQVWFGAVRVMTLAAFYANLPPGGPGAPISLSQAITYTWLGQGLLALMPWSADPDIAAAVRTGGISYDRLRPVDSYGLWYASVAGWIAARVAPRVALMAVGAGVALPLLGLSQWAWRPPADVMAALLFLLSIALALVLACAITMLLNIIVVATLNARGINTLLMPLVLVLSGNILPLSLYPDAVKTLFLVQPFAGVLDIPNRIYFGALSGGMAWVGLGLQAFWTVVLVILGRFWLARVMDRLQVQGG
jgi:ABC-2 type transport system permease protein